MYENFLNIDAEKRDRVIGAAMREFAEKGYKRASTNVIVKEAGISKGALFHYFTSKRELFEFLYSHNLSIYLDDIEPRLCELPSDVIARWSAYAMLKLDVAARYPLIFEFMFAAYRDDDPDVQAFMQQSREGFVEGFMQRLYDGIDLSMFKEGVDVQRALDVIQWTLEGFARRIQDAWPTGAVRDESYMRTVLEQNDAYLAILRRAFYKEEWI